MNLLSANATQNAPLFNNARGKFCGRRTVIIRLARLLFACSQLALTHGLLLLPCCYPVAVLLDVQILICGISISRRVCVTMSGVYSYRTNNDKTGGPHRGRLEVLLWSY